MPIDDVGHGVVGVGDSFMNGYGIPLGGVTCTSWGSWLGWALNTCFTRLAVDGASCEQVLRDQLPLLAGHYRLGAVWLGANDVARLEPERFESRLTALSEAMTRHCQTIAMATLPAALTSTASSQRAHAAAREELNARVRSVAARTGAVLVELDDALERVGLMAPDHEHPTALGQLTAAHAAAAALDADGMRFARHLPPVVDRQPTPAELRLYWPDPPSRLRRAVAAARRRPGR
ncbi:MAG: hypothetical protein NVSMB55_09650 [Mycobacteriales bacterium]